MEFFRIKSDIPFMRHAKLLNVISMVTFVAAIAFIGWRGLALSIEFTGGTVMEVRMPRQCTTAKPRTGPEPNTSSATPAIRVVMLESKIVAQALS